MAVLSDYYSDTLPGMDLTVAQLERIAARQQLPAGAKLDAALDELLAVCIATDGDDDAESESVVDEALAFVLSSLAACIQ